MPHYCRALLVMHNPYLSLGMEPIQRKGIIYEFDLVIDIADQIGTVIKTRCDLIPPQTRFAQPGPDVAARFVSWLEKGRSNGADWSAKCGRICGLLDTIINEKKKTAAMAEKVLGVQFCRKMK